MNSVAEAVAPRRWHYYGWNIVAICMFSQVAANGLTYNAFSLFVKDWSVDLNAPISQLQLAVAAMGLACALISPLIGTLADRLPARRLMACGLVGIGIFYVLVSFTTAAWQLIALYGLVVPLALNLSTSIVTNSLISRWFVRRLGLALGISSFGLGMAGVLLPPLIASLLPEVGWRMIWRGAGLVVALVLMPLVLLIVRNRATEREGLHYLTSDGSAPAVHAHGHGGGGAGGMSWGAVLSRGNFWLLVFIFLPIMAINGGVGQNIAPYAASHGLGLLAGGQLLSLLSFSNIVATLALGMMADRFGTRLPLAGLALLVAIGAAVLTFATDLPTIVVGCILVGFGGGVFTLLAAALAAEFGAEGVGRAFGTAMFFIPLVGLAPFTIAKVKENTGSYAGAFLGMMALVLVAFVLSLLLRPPRGSGAASTAA